ncbi:MAG: hypothetical protein HXK07_07515, partial [Actinomyces sp.]|nr:hypothetical protein [Actinomyces sp.]
MSFVSSLNETPYALTFAGQATPWRAALDEIARDPEIAEIVAGVIKASDQVLSPVRRSLATQSVASLPFELPATPESAAVTRDDTGNRQGGLVRAGLNIVAN